LSDEEVWEYLVLTRHGKTEYNERDLYTGWADIPVLPEGLEQAQEAGKVIRRFFGEIQVVDGHDRRISWATSPLQRARVTGEEAIVGAGLDLPQIELSQDPDLRERNTGSDTGTPVRRNVRVDYVHPGEGGESLSGAAQRTLRAISKARTRAEAIEVSGHRLVKVTMCFGHERIFAGAAYLLTTGEYTDESSGIHVPNARPLVLVKEPYADRFTLRP
jgi:broad specificity phosphatase PhoE